MTTPQQAPWVPAALTAVDRPLDIGVLVTPILLCVGILIFIAGSARLMWLTNPRNFFRTLPPSTPTSLADGSWRRRAARRDLRQLTVAAVAAVAGMGLTYAAVYLL